MRKYAREVTFCLVFEYLFNPEKNDLSLDLFNKEILTQEDIEFITNLYNGTIEHFEEYKQKVATYAIGYKVDRIYRVDLAILMIAMYEMLNMNTPAPVCANEAVEIAKKFSTQKSITFVNGLLAEFIKKELSTNTNAE